MAFFDDLTKKLSTAADIAVDKAKDLAETGKLKLDIATEEKEVQKQEKINQLSVLRFKQFAQAYNKNYKGVASDNE